MGQRSLSRPELRSSSQRFAISISWSTSPSPRDGSGKVIADVTLLSTQIAKVAKVALDIFGVAGLIGAKKNGDCKVIECLSHV